MKKEEKLFAKGFNDGYTMQEEAPGLLDTLLKSIIAPNDHVYVEGLKEGQKQRQKRTEARTHQKIH